MAAVLTVVIIIFNFTLTTIGPRLLGSDDLTQAIISTQLGDSNAAYTVGAATISEVTQSSTPISGVFSTISAWGMVWNGLLSMVFGYTQLFSLAQQSVNSAADRASIKLVSDALITIISIIQVCGFAYGFFIVRNALAGGETP
jgi:hypothetical protein